MNTTEPNGHESVLKAAIGSMYVADGGLMSTTKAKVTRIVLIILPFWLVVSIALVLTSVVMQLRLPDHRDWDEELSRSSAVANLLTRPVLRQLKRQNRSNQLKPDVGNESCYQ
jgi:hypothetical protein